MKTMQEIQKEIERLEQEILINTDRKYHFEQQNDIAMVNMYDRMNNVCISKISALQWVLNEAEE